MRVNMKAVRTLAEWWRGLTDEEKATVVKQAQERAKRSRHATSASE